MSIIRLRYGNSCFDSDDLIRYMAEQGMTYIIQGQVHCAYANHPKPHSLDYWLRPLAKNPDTAQAVSEVVCALIKTGDFEPGYFVSPDSDHPCKGLKRRTRELVLAPSGAGEALVEDRGKREALDAEPAVQERVTAHLAYPKATAQLNGSTIRVILPAIGNGTTAITTTAVTPTPSAMGRRGCLGDQMRLDQSHTTGEADMISLTAQEIDAALNKVARDLGRYICIQSRFRQCDVSTDLVFQTAFNGFYRVRQRSADWYKYYYTLFETAKASEITFDQALSELLRLTKRYEASFASKMVATLDPTRPVIDDIILRHFCLKLPYYGAPRREARTIEVYNELCKKYEALMQRPQGRTICTRFTEQYPEADITDIKKIDLVLWKTRSPKRTPAGTISVGAGNP
jgi:hypothetical protein